MCPSRVETPRLGLPVSLARMAVPGDLQAWEVLGGPHLFEDEEDEDEEDEDEVRGVEEAEVQDEVGGMVVQDFKRLEKDLHEGRGGVLDPPAMLHLLLGPPLAQEEFRLRAFTRLRWLNTYATNPYDYVPMLLNQKEPGRALSRIPLKLWLVMLQARRITGAWWLEDLDTTVWKGGEDETYEDETDKKKRQTLLLVSIRAGLSELVTHLLGARNDDNSPRAYSSSLRPVDPSDPDSALWIGHGFRASERMERNPDLGEALVTALEYDDAGSALAILALKDPTTGAHVVRAPRLLRAAVRYNAQDVIIAVLTSEEDAPLVSDEDKLDAVRDAVLRGLDVAVWFVQQGLVKEEAMPRLITDLLTGRHAFPFTGTEADQKHVLLLLLKTLHRADETPEGAWLRRAHRKLLEMATKQRWRPLHDVIVWMVRNLIPVDGDRASRRSQVRWAIECPSGTAVLAEMMKIPAFRDVVTGDLVAVAMVEGRYDSVSVLMQFPSIVEDVMQEDWDEERPNKGQFLRYVVDALAEWEKRRQPAQWRYEKEGEPSPLEALPKLVVTQIEGVGVLRALLAVASSTPSLQHAFNEDLVTAAMNAGRYDAVDVLLQDATVRVRGRLRHEALEHLGRLGAAWPLQRQRDSPVEEEEPEVRPRLLGKRRRQSASSGAGAGTGRGRGKRKR